jgi:flagellar secretion chaperone FliS
MSANNMERKYMVSAVLGASPIGLTILLYDRLVTDIRLAIVAMQSRDIEKRCAHINHAFLILGQLENGLNMESGGETAASLARFYACTRAKLIEGQVKLSSEILEKQIELILQVRSAWQQVENGSSAQAQNRAVPTERAQASPALMFQSVPDDGSHASSWTA